MTYTKQEREYYNQDRDRACTRLGITKNDFNWFRRQGNALHSIYEDNCNGYIPSEEQYEMRTAFYEQKVNKKANELQLCVYYQTDPRGATIYLDTELIPENSYNNAVCIY